MFRAPTLGRQSPIWPATQTDMSSIVARPIPSLSQGCLLNVQRHVERADVSVPVIARGHAQEIPARFERELDANGNAILHELLVGFRTQISLGGLRFQARQLAIRRKRPDLKFEVRIVCELWTRAERNRTGIDQDFHGRRLSLFLRRNLMRIEQKASGGKRMQSGRGDHLLLVAALAPGRRIHREVSPARGQLKLLIWSYDLR